MPIPAAKTPAESFHKMLLSLNPEGYDLKRISVFENPMRANLEFSKTRFWQKSVFELQVSLTKAGDELLYNIDTAKTIWNRKTGSFKEHAEDALRKVING